MRFAVTPGSLRRWSSGLSLLAALALAPPLPAAPAPVERARGERAQQGDPKPHKHVWARQTRKEWVPPETRRVQVGVDAKGNPIYETRIVRPGYWRTVTYFSCSCGATRS
jgi:hypothetical protein